MKEILKRCSPNFQARKYFQISNPAWIGSMCSTLKTSKLLDSGEEIIMIDYVTIFLII